MNKNFSIKKTCICLTYNIIRIFCLIIRDNDRWLKLKAMGFSFYCQILLLRKWLLVHESRLWFKKKRIKKKIKLDE